MALRFSQGLLTGLQSFGQGGAMPADPRERDRLQSAGVTNPLLQQFGRSFGSLVGRDMRSPAAIQQAQEEEAKAKTQGLILSQVEASTALTPTQKETYASMIRSGDVTEQQVLQVISQAEENKAKQSQVSAIKTNLLAQGFTEEQLANLSDAQIREYAKATIDQTRAQAQTMEGAAAYMETLNLDPEIKEQVGEVIASDKWTKLTPAQRTEYFKRQQDESKRRKDVSNITKMIESMPEGEAKKEAQASLQDLENGFVTASSIRDQIRAKKDSSITETTTVVQLEDGSYAKVANQKVGKNTVKVYWDSTANEYKPVTAEMLKGEKKVDSNWPSATAVKYVENLVLAGEGADVISRYVAGYDPWGFGDYRTTPAQALDNKMELSTVADKLKKEGKNPEEIKQGLINYINSKDSTSQDSKDVLSEADKIIQG